MAEMAVLNNVMATSRKNVSRVCCHVVWLLLINQRQSPGEICGCAAGSLAGGTGMAQATDLASAGKADVQATFGRTPR